MTTTTQAAPVPGQLHSEVPVIESRLRELREGEVIDYETLAETIGRRVNDPLFIARCTTARRRLDKEGVIITCVRGVGFQRENPDLTTSRVENQGLRSIRRKAKRLRTQIVSQDMSNASEETRTKARALAAVCVVTELATGKKGQNRICQAAQKNAAQLASQQVLEALKLK